MELTDRKKKILRAIVDNYIKTAEPVGSKVLSAMPDIPGEQAGLADDQSPRCGHDGQRRSAHGEAV